MSTANQIKTLIVKSRGRKYFSCIINNYKAKLVINEISSALGVDRVVKVEVKDVSKRSKYGTELIFEPVAILTDRDAGVLREAAAKRRTAEKWLGYAESDVADGHTATNAIGRANEYASEIPELSDRLDALNSRIDVLVEREETEAAIRFAKKQAKVSQTRLIPDAIAREGEVIDIRNGLKIELLERTFSQIIDNDAPAVHGAYLLGYEGERGHHWTFRVVE